MYKRILVPVDLAHPEAARRTAGVAKDLAGNAQCELVMLNVIPDLPGYVAAELPGEHMDKVRSRAEGELSDLAKDLGLVDKAQLIVRAGRPHNEILEYASEEDVDLIVIGSHQPGLQDYLLGSVAARVVRHAQCSVFVDRNSAS